MYQRKSSGTEGNKSVCGREGQLGYSTQTQQSRPLFKQSLYHYTLTENKGQGSHIKTAQPVDGRAVTPEPVSLNAEEV